FAVATVLQRNQIDGGSVQIRGGSHDTLLVDNDFRQAILGLEEQNDRRFGPGRPTGTTVRRGKITANDACIPVESATDTKIQHASLRCGEALRIAGGSGVTVQQPASGEGRLRVRCAGPGEVQEIRAGGKKAPTRTVCPGGPSAPATTD